MGRSYVKNTAPLANLLADRRSASSPTRANHGGVPLTRNITHTRSHHGSDMNE